MNFNVLKNEKGEAGNGALYLISTVLIICLLVLPLFAYFIENLRFIVIGKDVKNHIETAVETSYFSLNNTFLSKAQFIADNGMFTYYLKESLKESLYLDNALMPLENSKLDGPFDIDDVVYFDDSLLPYTDLDTGIVYTRPFVEVDYTLRFEPIFYKELIQTLIGNQYVEVQLKQKASLPVNN